MTIIPNIVTPPLPDGGALAAEVVLELDGSGVAVERITQHALDPRVLDFAEEAVDMHRRLTKLEKKAT